MHHLVTHIVNDIEFLPFLLSSTDNSKSSTSTLNLSQSSGGVGAGTSQPQQFDPWSVCLFGFLERDRILQKCPSVVAQAWPICYVRVTTLYSVIDPT